MAYCPHLGNGYFHALRFYLSVSFRVSVLFRVCPNNDAQEMHNEDEMKMVYGS